MPTESSTQHQPARAGSWAGPGLSVAIGIAYLIGGLAGGKAGFGVFGLLLCSVCC